MPRDAISAKEFLDWAADFGVGFRPGSPDHLTLLPPAGHAHAWALPADPAAWPPFLSALLNALDPWAAAYLWPRPGRWPVAATCTDRTQALRQHALRTAGCAGAARFDRDEADVAGTPVCDPDCGLSRP